MTPPEEYAANFTDDELAALNALTEAWNRFCTLPVQHPDDAQEFKASIRAAQRILLTRIPRGGRPGSFRVVPGGRQQ